MDLPKALRAGVEDAISGIPLSALAEAAAALSRRYRAELRDGRDHLGDDLTARAYLATRLPATYAASRASFAAAAELLPGFAPRTLLDLGAGPGTATWAAADCWPSIDDALLIEASGPIRRWGERFSAAIPISRLAWRDANLLTLDQEPARDLVCLSYVLGELPPEGRSGLVERLWRMTAELLVIVEPGTPAGWRRILSVRDRLIALGAHLVAPCPHALECPLAAPDWCHFSARVARSRVHRLAKAGEAPWEDEKYIYVAAARQPASSIVSRVLAPPRAAPGRVSLKLCEPDGKADMRLVTRREGHAYKRARRLDWGDAVRAADEAVGNPDAVP
jgi:ribosomal protein RSM22 (predicted rRNA methylase)